MNHVHRRSLSHGPGRAHEVAETVDSADRGLLERRDEEGAGEMRGMMLDPMHGRLPRAGLEAKRVRDRLGNRADFAVVGGAVADHAAAWPIPQRKQRLAPEMRLRVARDPDVVDLVGSDAGHFQAGSNRLRRKTRDVLDPAEPLFFDGGDELTVADQDRGDVSVVRVDAENIHEMSALRSRGLPTSVRTSDAATVGVNDSALTPAVHCAWTVARASRRARYCRIRPCSPMECAAGSRPPKRRNNH